MKQSLPLSFLLILTSRRVSRESVVTAVLARKSTYINIYTLNKAVNELVDILLKTF